MAQIAKNWSKIYRVHKYLPKGAYILTGGGHLKFVKYTPVRSTCGWCHEDVIKCPGGAKAKICKEKKTAQVHLGDHMRTLWNVIGFDPQAFEISEPEYDDLESAHNIGGDRKVLGTVHFLRQVD